jgi:hypothetical protein
MFQQLQPCSGTFLPQLGPKLKRRRFLAMVWLRGLGFGTMPRRRHLWLRLIIAVLILAAAVYGSLWARVEYEAYRAKSMLAEASRVQVGDAEASVLPFVRRYGGYKWTPEQLPPREQWIDKDEYDYQTNRLSDYKYELGISLFGTTALTVGRLARAMRGSKGSCSCASAISGP